MGERYGEIEYRDGKVLQRWRVSGGNVRLSHHDEFLVKICYTFMQVYRPIIQENISTILLCL